MVTLHSTSKPQANLAPEKRVRQSICLGQLRFYKEGRSLLRRRRGGGGARWPLRAADWLGQMPVPLPSRPVSGWPRGGARRRAERAGCAKLAGGVTGEAGRGRGVAGPGRHARHDLRPRPPGPTRLTPPPPPRPPARSVLAPRSTPRPRSPGERQPCGHRAHPPPRVSRARLSPRAPLGHGRTFVSLRAPGSRRRRRADSAGQLRSGRRGLAGGPWRRMGPASR